MVPKEFLTKLDFVQLFKTRCERRARLLNCISLAKSLASSSSLPTNPPARSPLSLFSEIKYTLPQQMYNVNILKLYIAIYTSILFKLLPHLILHPTM
jgi:hypothetical protein